MASCRNGCLPRCCGSRKAAAAVRPAITGRTRTAILQPVLPDGYCPSPNIPSSRNTASVTEIQNTMLPVGQLSDR